MQISCAVAAQLMNTFVFATKIVQSIFFLNLKFHASSLLMLLCRPVCVGSSWKLKPQRPFSQSEWTDDQN